MSSPRTINQIKDYFHKNKINIAVAGLIASGKTTLSHKISEMFDIPLYREKVTESKYLEPFYKDMRSESFLLQIHLMGERIKQQQQIIWGGKSCIQDRSIYEDMIFAKTLKKDGLMKYREFETYCDIFEIMTNLVPRPSYIIWLDVSPEKSMERLKQRNRGMESGVSLKYMTNLHTEYHKYMKELAKFIHVFRVDWEEFTNADKILDKIIEDWENIIIKNISIQ